MKLLNGADLAGFIKERQAKQVWELIQAAHMTPRLAIIQTKDDPVIDTYVRLKQDYSRDIKVDLEVFKIKQADAIKAINNCNNNPTISGIILQLPLSEPSQTDELIEALGPNKDIDGLNEHSPFSAATATAIDWLLAGYNVILTNKRIVIIGHGRLVGQPLFKLWRGAGHDVTVLDRQTKDLAQTLKTAEIIVTATGTPRLLTSKMIPIGAVVVDAGVASESGKTLGDLAPEVYERYDLTLTPKIGGVGPLTVAALFDNVIQAASAN